MKITRRQLRRVIRESLNEGGFSDIDIGAMEQGTGRYADPGSKDPQDPHGLIGMEVQAASGGDFGHRVLDYDPQTEDYVVQSIRWSTGEVLEDTNTIDVFKITYRYDTDNPRPARA